MKDITDDDLLMLADLAAHRALQDVAQEAYRRANDVEATGRTADEQALGFFAAELLRQLAEWCEHRAQGLGLMRDVSRLAREMLEKKAERDKEQTHDNPISKAAYLEFARRSPDYTRKPPDYTRNREP